MNPAEDTQFPILRKELLPFSTTADDLNQDVTTGGKSNLVV